MNQSLVYTREILERIGRNPSYEPTQPHHTRRIHLMLQVLENNQHQQLLGTAMQS